MNEIKFRYRLRLKTTAGEKIYTEIFNLVEIERGSIGAAADVVAREQFACAHDKDGNELYVGDKIKYFNRTGVVKFDEDKRAFALWTEKDNVYVHFSKFVLRSVELLKDVA